MIAEVVVDVPAPGTDRVFHYDVPAGLEGMVRVGSRVLVPFGGRQRVEGFVVGLTEATDIERLKPIERLLSSEPDLTADGVALARWLADEFPCYLSEALRALLPPGRRSLTRRLVTPVADAERLAALVAAGKLGEREQLAHEALAVAGEVTWDEALTVIGGPVAGDVLRRLLAAGLARVSTAAATGATSQTRLVAELTRPVSEDEIRRLLARAPRQSEVLRKLQGGPCPLAALGPAGAAAARALAGRGTVRITLAEQRRDPAAAARFAPTTALPPTDEQARALARLIDAPGRGFLLHGVTGSGKTEVYLQAIAASQAAGCQSLVMVPEISLTPQMVARFKGRFGDRVAVLHSRLATGERYDEWRRIQRGEADIVVGARSAVFAPLTRPGLIILDEEHEISYKQEETPRYQARDVAARRARTDGATLLLGSATPALETYYRTETGELELLRLTRRIDSRPLPSVELVDLRQELAAGNRTIFSRRLTDAIGERLARGEQSLLFLNRRGYSTFLLCRDCGHVIKCPDCDVALTLHLGEGRLTCHYCGYTRRAPNVCPSCGSRHIRHFGTGTERVAEEARRLFPNARVARMDSDTTVRKGSHEEILSAFAAGEIDILVGTQMIAKGLDIAGVTLVGVITADTSLNLPDFRASERTFQLVTQVAGRAGRGDLPGEVVIQTYAPDHYALQTAQNHDYETFYRTELDVRRTLAFPPFTSLLNVVISASSGADATRAAQQVGILLTSEIPRVDPGAEVLGPTPAPLARLRGRTRVQVLIKTRQRAACVAAAKRSLWTLMANGLPGDARVVLDVDPLAML